MTTATDTTVRDSSSTPPATPAGTATHPHASNVRVSGAGGGGLRAALFALVVLVPVVALGYVFWDVSRTGGIRTLPDGTTYVNLHAMSTFSFDQRDGTLDDVPQQYRALDGQRVALDGEMFVDGVASGDVEEFSLVYSIADCCFTGTPQVQHFVRSTTEPGRPVRKYNGLVRATGVLRVDVTREAGAVTGVYHLEVERVEPLG